MKILSTKSPAQVKLRIYRTMIHHANLVAECAGYPPSKHGTPCSTSTQKCPVLRLPRYQTSHSTLTRLAKIVHRQISKALSVAVCARLPSKTTCFYLIKRSKRSLSSSTSVVKSTNLTLLPYEPPHRQLEHLPG